MKSYLDLVGESAKVHKKKNRITVLCIVIAVCLVTAIFGMADMEIRTRTISAIKEYGNYHVVFKHIDGETAKLVGSRVDVEVSGWVRHSGYGNLGGKQLEVMGGDEAISREMGLTIINGRFPEKSDEAVLDRQAAKEFAISLDEEISVTLPDGTARKFTIVGFFGDFASLKAADTHGLYLSNKGIEAIGNTERNCYYVQFKNHANMRKAIDEIKANYHFSDKQVSENSYLLGLKGQSRDSYMLKLYMTAAVLFVLVLIAGVLMIASSFNMSVLERVQFFGLLRCLGASQAQIKKIVLLEGIHFSIKGIPIGLLAGTFIVWAASAFLKYVNPTFFNDMPLFGISWPSLITGVLVGFLTVILASFSPCKKAAKVSPLSAVTGNIYQSNVPQSKRAAKTKHLQVDIAMGLNHAFTSKKNILLMTGSFAISIILFLSFSVMVNFMYQAVKPLKPYTPDLSIISGNNTCSLDTTLLEQIKRIPEVKRVYGRMFAYDVPIISLQGSGKINLISYEQNQFHWAKKQLVQGSIESAALKGTDSVLVVYSKDVNWQVGDTLALELPLGEKKVQIAGLLATSPFDSQPGTQTVICSEKLFCELTGERGYTIIDMQLAKGADDDKVSQIRSLTTSQMKFSDQRQGNEEVRTAFYSFAIFIYGFLLIIASITVFNIINSINMSVTGRMNQYGVMRAIGMSGPQLQHVVIAEAGTYAICGCITGCVLGLPLHRFIFHSMITSRWSLQWQPPFAALAIIIGIAVFTTFLSVIGPVKKINTTDIVNVVNAQ